MRVTVVAVGSRGDVQPYVALAAGLQRAGISVAVATHDTFSWLLSSHGLEFRRLRADPRGVLDTEAGVSWLESGSNPLKFYARLRTLARDHGVQLADDVLAACGDADAIVGSALGISAYHVAEARAVPYVAALLQPATPTAAFPSAMLPVRSLGAIGNRLSARAAAQLFHVPFRGAIDQWRRQALGLPPVADWDFYRMLNRRRQPVLYGYSPLVVPRPADWGSWIQVTGYWFLPAASNWSPPPRLAEFLAEGPPPVYFGFGSMRPRDPQRLAATVFAAIRRSGARAVVSRGWADLDGAADAAGGDGGAVLTVGDVPHDWLFPRMAAVVHHGGAGTTGTALAAGVPSVVVPFFADQFFWAERVRRLGAGPPALTARRLTAAGLAAAVTAAASNVSMRAVAGSVATQLRAEDGVANAVAAFEQMVSGRTAPRASVRQVSGGQIGGDDRRTAMVKPQSPELRRSGYGSTDQDGAEIRAADETVPEDSAGKSGPVPEANRPGHHPEREQDKPDPDARP